VFDANVDKSFHFEAGDVRAIEQSRPGLTTLEEFTPPAPHSMVASGVPGSASPTAACTQRYKLDGLLYA
jgi:hypothetical protein